MNRLFNLVFFIFIGFNVLYAITVIFLVPILIEEAYYEQSISVINRVLDDGRDSHGLQFYIRIWFVFAWRIWLVVAGILLTLLILTHHRFKQYFTNLTTQAEEAKNANDWDQTMPRYRRLTVYGVIFIVLFGSLFDIFFRMEHWPFSPYYMYSNVQPDTFGWNMLYGITANEEEFPLSDEISTQYFHPYDNDKVAMGIFWLNNKPDREILLERALDAIIQRYETNREAGRHNGPLLQGVRVYHEEWDMDPSMKNKGNMPDRRTQLMEVIR